MKTKKIISLLLSVFLLLLLALNVSVSASAANNEIISGTHHNLGWRLDKSTGALIIYGTGDMESLYASAWTRYSISIKSVVIQEGVTSLSRGAFSSCTNLTNVTLPNSLKRIDDMVFCNCRSLEKIRLPENLEALDYKAFESCVSLTEMTIPEGVKYLAFDTFRGCESLKSVSLPSSIESISKDVFANCPALTEIVFCGEEQAWNEMFDAQKCGLATAQYNVLFHKYQSHRISKEQHETFCTYCQKAHPVAEIAPHTWDDGTVTIAPSHITYGKILYACTDCGITREESLDPIPHAFGEWQKGPFNHSRVCSCGHTEQQSHIYKDDRDSTCEICGAKKLGSCGATVSSALPLLLLCSGAAVMIRKKDQI